MTMRRNAKPGETVRYVGANIGYIPGIPMKDMGDEEWNALDSDLRAWAIQSGMYQLGGPEEGAQQLAAAKNEPPANQSTPAQTETKPASQDKGKKEG